MIYFYYYYLYKSRLCQAMRSNGIVCRTADVLCFVWDGEPFKAVGIDSSRAVRFADRVEKSLPPGI